MVVMEKWWDIFCPAVEDLGVRVEPSWEDPFSIYLGELLFWNQKMNLSGLKTSQAMAVTLLADSLVINKWPGAHHNNLQVLDVGTGAGIPGIPLAITHPSWQVTLLEATQKKCDFLKHVTEKMGLRADVLWGRAEEAAHQKEHREHYDLVLSRAVAPLATNLELALPLVKVGGFFATFKSEPIEEELKSAEKALKILGGALESKISYSFRAESDKAKTVLLIQKTHASPDSYPRKPGMPAKKPLKN